MQGASIMTKIEEQNRNLSSFPFLASILFYNLLLLVQEASFLKPPFSFLTFSQHRFATAAFYLACAFEQNQLPPLLFGPTWLTWPLYQDCRNLHLQPKQRTAQKPAGIAGGVAVAHAPFLIVEQILRCRRERLLGVDHSGAN
jgi:hypothetical protein